MMGFWNAMTSAGHQADSLHLAPDRQSHQSHQHLIIQFLNGLDALPDAQSTV